MKVKILALIAAMALSAVPVRGNGGVFYYGSDLGYVHPIGFVTQGSQIDVELFTGQNPPLDNLTCPLKATLIVVQRNNFNNIHRKTVRRNATVSRLAITSARFDGEAMLIVQSQNINHECAGIADIVVTFPATVSALGGALDSSSLGASDDVPPDIPMTIDSADMTEVQRRLFPNRR